MLDIKWIRENAEALDQALLKRSAEPIAAKIITMDQKRREQIAKLQDAQERRNSASKEIGQALASGNRMLAEALKSEMNALKESLSEADADAKQLSIALDDELMRIPNVPLDDVPVGNNENDNVELRKFGTPPAFPFEPKEHYQLGENLGMMDFERASRISGARFTILSGSLARLERALGQFMLDLHTQEHGYKEISAPILVRDDALLGTAQLPKFTEDLFRTTDDRWLIPTAEVPLTNLVRGEIVDEESLPLRYTALTPCFRSEAGSAGRDTRGMLRQHQFWKVEMVSITSREQALDELERMTQCAEAVLKRLELPFRTIVLCTGDMGFSACKTYDLEVWLPGQNSYREISSCSLCGDFQGRRMNARYRNSNEKNTHFVHTLNGSGTAVGRCLIALMENYQQVDGSIVIPDVLRPYLGGLERIKAKS